MLYPYQFLNLPVHCNPSHYAKLKFYDVISFSFSKNFALSKEVPVAMT